jgi:hypothetical protein
MASNAFFKPFSQQGLWKHPKSFFPAKQSFAFISMTFCLEIFEVVKVLSKEVLR